MKMESCVDGDGFSCARGRRIVWRRDGGRAQRERMSFVFDAAIVVLGGMVDFVMESSTSQSISLLDTSLFRHVRFRASFGYGRLGSLVQQQ